MEKCCKIEGCERKGNIRYNGNTCFPKGYCKAHYAKLIRNGDPLFEKRRIGENRRKNPLYKTYAGMKRRCYNINDTKYADYGGRGITISNEWLGMDGFSRFLVDMGEKPTPQHSIDRINNNGNYEPNNCRWATLEEQSKNKRKQKNGNPITGICLGDKRNAYRVIFAVNGKSTHFGYYKTYELAVIRINELEMQGIMPCNR